MHAVLGAGYQQATRFAAQTWDEHSRNIAKFARTTGYKSDAVLRRVSQAARGNLASSSARQSRPFDPTEDPTIQKCQRLYLARPEMIKRLSQEVNKRDLAHCTGERKLIAFLARLTMPAQRNIQDCQQLYLHFPWLFDDLQGDS